ncbi:xanthine dehydrogenase accessory protein XdhC [Profundibacterium mesophilum]|uniref:Molybdenum cofactor sulfurylase n=1 Tax=Profundibacterium mesophilum KAUST100406-0324 TaxID=1037889 RepID=A0A921NW98_9RHOB|nr:xanthine dehydrogenase accessory protein XdhC [Profundibacterium mesophilum]KAF0676833.1 Molybdenum cofactor sulfurylase [Profundibacterium mesophilum KAUST100406-0324]
MSFDPEALRDALTGRSAVWRVVVAATAGSVPREVGASMLVWEGGQSGTIGGGALEHEAAARAPLAGPWELRHVPLGPGLGQCCGGAVTLLTERWDMARLAALEPGAVFLRGPEPGAPPPAMRRLAALAAQGTPPAPQLAGGWMMEPVSPARRPVWLHGAGHVGRAVCALLAPLPGIAVTWLDTARERFPDEVPRSVSCRPVPEPGRVIGHAPHGAAHLVMTYSHALDLEICHQLLRHEFAYAGLIGSATKRARFIRRLQALGHPADRIARITCPIGDPSLGKHPQAIAIGVAASLLKEDWSGPVRAVERIGVDRSGAGL